MRKSWLIFPRTKVSTFADQSDVHIGKSPWYVLSMYKQIVNAKILRFQKRKLPRSPVDL